MRIANMTNMTKWCASALALLSLSTAAARAAGPTPPPTAYSEGRAQALAISQAFAAGNAKTFRLAATTPLARLEKLSDDDLAATLAAAVDVAKERGQQGLEGFIATAAAALGARDFDGWVRADDELGRLAEHLWVSAAVAARPNATLPIARPGSPVVHYVPLKVGRMLLGQQVQTGRLDVEDAFRGICGPASREQLVAQYGARMADMLARLCDHATGTATSGGLPDGTGLGFGSEISLVDCIQSHNQTRAEQLAGLMQECAESLLDAESGGPVDAGGGKKSKVPIAPKKTDGTDNEWNPQLPDYPAPKDPTDVLRDPAEDRLHEHHVDENGDMVDIYLDKDTGQPTRGTAMDREGNVEEVYWNEDGSYDVTHYDKNGNILDHQAYDANGKPIGGSGNAKDAPGMDWGATDECRELSVALIGDRAAAVAIDRGLLDPRVVNPSPEEDRPGSVPSDLDCLGIAAGPQLDAGFGCNKNIAMCPPGLMLDAGCGCKAAAPTMSPARQCGIFMLCADGVLPQQRDGSCSCGDVEEIFYDAGTGPRPRPAPPEDFDTGPLAE